MVRNLFGLAAFVIALAPFCARADFTYVYAGNPYTFAQVPFDTTMAVTGSVTFASALADGNYSWNANFDPAPPAGFSYSFFDGITTYSSADSQVYRTVFQLEVSNGAIDLWNIRLAKFGDGSTGGLFGQGGVVAAMVSMGGPIGRTFQEDEGAVRYTYSFTLPGGPPLPGFPPLPPPVITVTEDRFAQADFNPGTWSAAPIPEPETYAMLMAGLGFLGWTARRRNQQA